MVVIPVCAPLLSHYSLSLSLSASGPPPPYDGGHGTLPPPPPYYNTAGHPPSSSVHQPVLVQPAHVCHTVVVRQRRPVVAVSVPAPPDYMCLAVIATLFCFPLGLIAVTKSIQVNLSVIRKSRVGLELHFVLFHWGDLFCRLACSANYSNIAIPRSLGIPQFTHDVYCPSLPWLQVRSSLRDGDICAAYRNAHQSRLLSRFAITLGILLTMGIVLPSVLVPLIYSN